MSFISIEFIILMIVVTATYFSLSQRSRTWFLFIVSYIFYAFSRLEYVLLLAFTTVINYYAGVELAKSEQERKRRLLVGLSLVINFGLLFIFKYFNFFSDAVHSGLGFFGIAYQPLVYELILPLGISFHTFQSVAYIIDIYRKKIDAEKDFVTFATFTAFFPQLVAGPIERAAHILPQFHRTTQFDYERVVSGLRLILWGTFKKVVIANRLALYANDVYNDVGHYSGLPLIMATFFFTFQIYCDFSGYSDIAIGTARILGFDLMENFRQPYFATSIRDFWRRWHISLSTWFRDYLYIPLGGNRVSFGRNLINLMIVFVVSGLWHGANWTFIIWGALHGFYTVVEILVNHWIKRDKIHPLQLWLQRGLTFIVVMFTWIFFRANSLADANYVLAHFFDFSAGRQQLLEPLFQTTSALDVRIEFVIMLVLIAFLMVVEWVNINYDFSKLWLQRSSLRWIVYHLAVAAIIFTILAINAEQQFIYFQF